VSGHYIGTSGRAALPVPNPLCNHRFALNYLSLLLALLTLALYLVAGLALAHSVRQGRTGRQLAATLMAFGAVVVHGLRLFGATHTADHGVAIAITDSASLVGWVIGATTATGMLFVELAALPSALLLLAGVLSMGTGLLTGFAEVSSQGWEVTAHIALAALAAGWLAIAAFVVVLLALQDARFRARAPLGPLALLPPMETMERTVFRALSGGYVVLTLALVTGLFFVYNVFEQHLIHKIILALIAWTLFGVLLYGRYRFGWRGRQAFRFTLAGFVALALAYFGSKFVLENVLGRHWG